MMPGGGVWLAPPDAGAVAVAVALLGIAPAVLGARLAPVIRHGYTLHYLAMGTALSACFGYPALELLGAWGTLAAGLHGGGVAMAIACVAASAGRGGQDSVALALVGAGFGLCLMRVGGAPWIAGGAWLVAAVVMAARRDGHAAPAVPGPPVALGLYLLINALALLVLGSLFLVVVTELFAPRKLAPAAGAILALPDGTVPTEDGLPWQRLAQRALLAFGGTALGLALPWLWPAGWRTRVGDLAAALAMLAAGALVARIDTVAGELALPVVAVALGTIMAAGEPRARRLPWALVCGALGWTLGMQWLAAPMADPLAGLYPWAWEWMATLAVWCVAYLWGIRTIRRRLDDAATPASPQPPADRPA